MGQKFRQNRSISLCFQDKPVFALNAEIQDGHQKWRENVVLQKKPVDSADTLPVKNFVEIALSLSVSARMHTQASFHNLPAGDNCIG